MMWLILAWLISLVVITTFMSMAARADRVEMEQLSDAEFFEHVDDDGRFRL